MKAKKRTTCRWCGKPVVRFLARRSFCSEECVQAWAEHDKAKRLEAVASDLATWQKHLEGGNG